MNSITIKTRLDSGVIQLGKQAHPLIGKNVEIIIRELTGNQPTEKNGAI